MLPETLLRTKDFPAYLDIVDTPMVKRNLLLDCIHFVLNDRYWDDHLPKVVVPTTIKISRMFSPTRELPCNGGYFFSDKSIQICTDFSGEYFPSCNFGNLPYQIVRRDFEYLTWQESIVGILAHEMQHLVQDLYNLFDIDSLKNPLDIFTLLIADPYRVKVTKDVETDAINTEFLFLCKWREYLNDLG